MGVGVLALPYPPVDGRFWNLGPVHDFYYRHALGVAAQNFRLIFLPINPSVTCSRMDRLFALPIANRSHRDAHLSTGPLRSLAFQQVGQCSRSGLRIPLSEISSSSWGWSRRFGGGGRRYI